MSAICPLCLSPLEWLYDDRTDIGWLACLFPGCGYARIDRAATNPTNTGKSQWPLSRHQLQGPPVRVPEVPAPDRET